MASRVWGWFKEQSGWRQASIAVVLGHASWWLFDKAATLFYEQFLEQHVSWERGGRVMTAVGDFLSEPFVLGFVVASAIFGFGPLAIDLWNKLELWPPAPATSKPNSVVEETTTRPKVEPTEAAAQEPRFLSVRHLFINDLKSRYTTIHVSKYNMNLRDVNVNEERTLTFEINIHIDQTANGKFFGVYIPMQNDRPWFLAALLNLGQFAEAAMKYFEENLKMEGEDAIAEYHEKSTLEGLTFTRIIYVYYENPLDLEEVAHVSSVLKSQGIRPRFRGPRYVSERQRLMTLAQVNRLSANNL